MKSFFNSLKKSPFIKKFLSNKYATISLALLLLTLAVSFLAPLIANDKPLVMSYKNKLFFPVFKKYLPTSFEEEDFVVDYLVLAQKIKIEKTGWAIFPPIKQRPYEPNIYFDILPAPPGTSTILAETESTPGFKTTHWIGTDTSGRDLFTRLLYALRNSLGLAILITLTSLLLGIFVGLCMGYFGGTFDLLLGRVLETIEHFPVIYLLITLSAFINNPSMFILVGIFTFIGFVSFSFWVRGQVLKARRMTYVESAKAIGQSDFKIMIKHIFPNAIISLLSIIPFAITSNIQSLAIIDFLGFGVQPPTASLGAILRSGFENLQERWWLVFYSSLLLVFILLIINYIGQGVRDGLDSYYFNEKKKNKVQKAYKESLAKKN